MDICLVSVDTTCGENVGKVRETRNGQTGIRSETRLPVEEPPGPAATSDHRG